MRAKSPSTVTGQPRMRGSFSAMPLLAELQPFVDMLNSLEPPPPAQNEAEQVAVMRATIGLLQAPVDESLAIGSVEDRVIEHGGLRIPVRVFVPKSEPVAVLVYFHGGGFTIGNIDTHDAIARRYCANGSMVVINVEYRLAPENNFPGGVDDALHAALWAQENAGAFGFGGDRVFVAGDSAGGNLAAVTAQSHARLVREGVVAAPLAGHIMHCPVTDGRASSNASYPSRKENATGFMLTEEMMNAFLHFYSQSGANPDDVRVSPILADDLEGLSPALLITAEFDPLRDEGEAYGAKLRNAGCKVTMCRFDGTIHVFMTLPMPMSCTDEADALVFDFVRENVR